MRSISFPAERCRSAHDHADQFPGCDSAPPNHRAHRRWFIAMLCVFAIAAAVALIGGMLHGLSDMAGAFTSLSALFDGASWDRFFAGFGRVAALVLAIVLTVLVLKRNRRRTRASRPKP